MIYPIVLFGSLGLICLWLLFKFLWRNRSIRRFVRNMQKRWQMAEERGAVLLEETKIEKPRKDPRTSAIELQEVRSLVREADKCIAQEKFDEAERHYIQALTIHPEAYNIQAELARLYLTTGRETKAVALYKEILLKKDDVSYFSNLGLAYYKQQQFIDACHAYQEALNRDPKNPDRSAALGRACIAAKRFKEAAPLLAKATERLPRDTELLGLLAECYLQIGQQEKAEETYRQINRLEPYNEKVKEKLSTLTKA